MNFNMKNNITFTLVSTTYNEISSINETIKTIEAQTLKPDNIIIVDAKSNDGTIDVLNNWAQKSNICIKIIIKEKCTISEGRNIAIKNANTPIIVSTDFGCSFNPHWLEKIIKPFYEDPEVEVSGTNYTLKKDKNPNFISKIDFIAQGGYLQEMKDDFVLGNRSIAYKKYVWEKIGGYPEWLKAAADDTIFWNKIKENNFKYMFINEHLVFWTRPNKLNGFIKEAVRYGFGDGESNTNLRKFISLNVEYICKLLFPVFIVYSFLFPSFTIYAALLLSSFGLRSSFRTYKNWLKVKSSTYNLLLLPFAFLLVDYQNLSYLSGYIKGYLHKLNNK